MNEALARLSPAVAALMTSLAALGMLPLVYGLGVEGSVSERTIEPSIMPARERIKVG